MRKTEKEKLEKALLTRKEELLDEMGIIMDTNFSSTIKESTGDISHYSYHMADQATDNMERELAFMFASKSGRLVYHIDEALRRMQSGEYGKCVVCSKIISFARLEAVPHARMCIHCKSAEEEQKTAKQRKR